MTLAPSQWRLFDRALVVVLGLMFGVFGWAGVHERHRTDKLVIQGVQSHIAICALKNDYLERVQQGKQFLVDHPSGVPGIPAETIAASIRLQQQTVAALDVIRC